MKLALERFKDLSILVASGPISVENFAILRAGIKKLFKDGKNKIILELPDSSSFPAEVLRELAALNLIARELSGQIVLTKIDEATRKKIENFAAPPIIYTFSDRDSAIAYFHPPAVDEGSPPEPAAAAPLPAAQPAPAPASGTAAAPATPGVGQSKAEIRQLEMGDLGTVKKRLSELETENIHLKEQLVSLVIRRREAPDLKAAQEKIEIQQKQIDDLITQLNAAPAKK